MEQGRLTNWGYIGICDFCIGWGRLHGLHAGVFHVWRRLAAGQGGARLVSAKLGADTGTDAGWEAEGQPQKYKEIF